MVVRSLLVGDGGGGICLDSHTAARPYGGSAGSQGGSIESEDTTSMPHSPCQRQGGGNIRLRALAYVVITMYFLKPNLSNILANIFFRYSFHFFVSRYLIFLSKNNNL